MKNAFGELLATYPMDTSSEPSFGSTTKLVGSPTKLIESPT
jgi:hypothetical protein